MTDASTGDATPKSFDDRARELVAKLASHDFAGVEQAFDDTMRAALPKEKLEATWLQIEKSAGAFGKLDSIEAQEKDGLHVMLCKAAFAHAPLVLRVVFDGQGRVTGLLVMPGDTAAAWQPPPYAKLDSFEERPVTVGASPALPGTLSVPKGAKSFPVVVLVHGSGPNDADETIGALKPFKDLAFGLASRGVAVLRYEKRTHASPAGVRTEKEEVDDAAHAAVALAHGTPGADPKRVVLLGHSQGGFLAPRIAKADPLIRAVVILAGSTRPLQDSLVAQAKYFVSLAPDNAEAQKFVEKAQRFKVAVEKKDLKADAMVETPFGNSMPGEYFLAVRDYQAPRVAATLGIPMLVLQGERDYQVTVADDFAAWRSALGSRKNVTLRTYPALNHAFAAGSGPPSPAEYQNPAHVDEKVVGDIASWINGL